MSRTRACPAEPRLPALLLALLASGFPLIPSTAFAWTSDGHRVIGAIADFLLAGTRTSDQVEQILGSSLRAASVWADCVKGSVMDESRTVRYRVDPVFTECRRFENPLAKGTWSTSPAAIGMDAVDRRRMISATSNTTTPMSRFSATRIVEARLARRITTSSRRSTHASQCCVDIPLRHPSTSTTSAKRCACSWATDTLKIGKRAFENVRYSNRNDAHRRTVTLPADYSTTRGRVQRDRLIKAGARLAQLLQAVFP